MQNQSKRRLLSAVCGSLIAACISVNASAEPSGFPKPTVSDAIDVSKLVSLVGNTRPETHSAVDLGAVPDSLDLGHMYLQLKRSPEREAALEAYIAELHDPQSSNFHQWLTPEEFAAHYGVNSLDVAKVTSWLKSQGFTVHGVAPTGLVIDFSGTAGQVRTGLHAEMHQYKVKGVTHLANASDPQVPAALAPAIVGVISLHDFQPKPQNTKKIENPAYTVAVGTQYELVPGDIQTIYNVSPLLSGGISGKGQTIMVLEDTYLYSETDWTIFRKTFGLARAYPAGTLAQESPSGSLTCTNPGANGDDIEAIIDAEWASAVAPSAAIVLAACSSGSAITTFGGLVAIENVVNGAGTKPNVVSMSYGEGEILTGAAGIAAFNTAFQQAAAEGITVFVSSGDYSSNITSQADGGAGDAGYGYGVTGWGESPYVVSVGGLDFGWAPDGVPPSTYWSTTNSSTYSSALSYIQEIPWNNSCAGGLEAAYLAEHDAGTYGITATTTPVQLCELSAVTKSSGALHSLYTTVGGGGGPSGCATGTYSNNVPDVVSGTCAGFAKPSWQSGVVGNPADGVRDVPDVALMASNGFWGSYFAVCFSGSGDSCQGVPSTWAGYGGTSISAPMMAAMQALANQATGAQWGQADTVYYSLASTEYGASGSAACNSTTVAKTGNSCVFYDITQGDNDSFCTKDSSHYFDCYIPSGQTVGVLDYGPINYGTNAANGVDGTASTPVAFSTGTGWDFPSGIGSVNAYNFVQAFLSYQAAAKHQK